MSFLHQLHRCMPEFKVGVLPMQGMRLLQDLVPRSIVCEWALPGEPFSAHEAKSVGPVNPVAPLQSWTPKLNG